MIIDTISRIMKDEVDFKVDKNLENNDLTNLDIIEKFCDNSKLSK